MVLRYEEDFLPLDFGLTNFSEEASAVSLFQHRL